MFLSLNTHFYVNLQIPINTRSYSCRESWARPGECTAWIPQLRFRAWPLQHRPSLHCWTHSSSHLEPEPTSKSCQFQGWLEQGRQKDTNITSQGSRWFPRLEQQPKKDAPSQQCLFNNEATVSERELWGSDPHTSTGFVCLGLVTECGRTSIPSPTCSDDQTWSREGWTASLKACTWEVSLLFLLLRSRVWKEEGKFRSGSVNRAWLEALT